MPDQYHTWGVDDAVLVQLCDNVREAAAHLAHVLVKAECKPHRHHFARVVSAMICNYVCQECLDSGVEGEPFGARHSLTEYHGDGWRRLTRRHEVQTAAHTLLEALREQGLDTDRVLFRQRKLSMKLHVWMARDAISNLHVWLQHQMKE